MKRRKEPEVMGTRAGAVAYAEANFAKVNEAFVERLVALVGRAPRLRVADLGCGPGDIPIRIAVARPRWTVLAVDASAAMLRLARSAIDAARAAARIGLLLSDAKRLGLASGVFDAVVSNSILHHVSSPVAFWREVGRLARPGALIFMRDLYRPADLTAARAIVARLAGAESARLRAEFLDSLLAAYRPTEVRAQLTRAGLAGLSVTILNDRHMDIVGRLPPASSSTASRGGRPGKPQSHEDHEETHEGSRLPRR